VEERATVGNRYPGFAVVYRWVRWNGFCYMEGQPRSGYRADSSQHDRRTGSQFPYEPDRGSNGELPTWYHWTTLITVTIGFAIIVFLAAKHGG